MKNVPDEELVEKIRSENNELYAEIVRRYQQKLYRYLRYLTNRPDEAEDLLQDVIIKVYRNLFGFDTKKKFSSWIYRIAHNEGLNFLKKTARKKQVSLENVDFSPESEDDSIEDAFGKKEMQGMVKECLDGLEAKYREPLVLYYFEDKS